MATPQVRLAQRRQMAYRRGSRSRRPLLLVTFAAIAAGLLSFSPFAPMRALAPTTSGGVDSPPLAALPIGPIPDPAPLPAASPAPASPSPSSQPAPPPTAQPTGDVLLSLLRMELSSTWVKNHRETDLRSGPEERSTVFTALPQWTTLRQVETRGAWTLVYFEGDAQGRQPGPGWVHTADIGAVGAPTLWVATTRPTRLTDDRGQTLEVASGVRAEVFGTNPIDGARVRVRTPGDGRSTPPALGWIDAASLTRVRELRPNDLPRAYPVVLNAEVRLPVPYRTQLDGSRYADANCGPVALGMALEMLGVNLPSGTLRERVLLAQDMKPQDEDAGSFVWALAAAAQTAGAHPLGLYAEDGTTLRRWSVDDVRREVRQGRPVILQVRYRGLPGRETNEYYGDHYIVVKGLVGDDLLYNDSIDNDGPGWDRIMSETQLRNAMNASDRPYAYTGFAVAR